MAGSKNEAKIKFTAETSDFTQSVKDANSELSSLRAEMKLNEAQFQNTGDGAEYMSTKQELLQESLQANHDKQEALTQKLELAKEIYGEDSEEVAKLERQLTYAQTEEQKMLTEVNNLNGGLDDQKQAADDAGSATDTMAEILVNAGIADAIKDIASAAEDMAQEFSEASAAVVEGTGASGDALDGLNDSAKTAFGSIADSDASLSSVSEILAELNTRFGVTGDEATDLTTKVSNFAQHTGTDGVGAVDSIANVMKRWGLDMDDVDGLLDDLTTANQSCQLSVDDLTGYLTENSTQFQELGYSTEDALGMLISLSDGGANVGSVMSGMKKAVGSLSDVTDDVPGAFQDAIKAISECDNVSEALQAQVGDTGLTVEDVFGAKAAQELATNVQNGNFNIEKWTDTLANNQGALQNTTEGATTMEDAWSQATNNVSMALGSTFAPAISDVVTKVSEVITKVAQVVQDSPALQAVVIGVAAALAILATALGISAAIAAVQKAMALLNTTMFANPIFLVITALAALAAGIAYAYTHCETFRNAVNNAFTVIKTVVMNVLTTVRDFIKTTFDTIKGIFTTVWTAISTFMTTVWTGIKTGISTAVNAIKTVISTVFSVIKTVITTYVNAWKLVITTVWTVIKTAVTTVVNAIKTVISTVFNAVKTTISTIFNGIKTTATTVWNGIKTAVTTPINAAKSTVSSAINGIRSTVSSVFNSVKSTVTSVWNGIKSAITTPIEAAKNKVKSIIDAIKGFFHFSISWPHIPTPHFGISPSGWKIGDLLKGSIPHLSIEWRKDGAVFSKPTIIPTMRGMQGVGEAGREAVAPIDVLQGYVEESVERAMQGTAMDYDVLADKVASACAKMNVSIELDNRELGRVVRGCV